MSRALTCFLLAGLMFGALVGHARSAPKKRFDYCCADDQNVSGWFSNEFSLLHMEWGWPEGDPRELEACAALGGPLVGEDGRIDPSLPGGFETPFEPCRDGHGAYETRPEIAFRFPYYVQVRFICNNRYPCGGLTYVLSRAVPIAVTGLPPPPPRCRVPRVIGLTLVLARRRVHRALCVVGRIRRVRSARSGRVIAQNPSPGSNRRRDFPMSLVVGRR